MSSGLTPSLGTDLGQKPAVPSNRLLLDKGGEEDPQPRLRGGGRLLPCLFETTQSVRSKNQVAKKAETLFLNLEDLVKRCGLTHVGFMTLTFAENLCDREEAQRRFNSITTNFLREEVDEYVAAVERQSRGAIHYHLVCAFPFDVRTGFDFEACTRANAAKRAGDTYGHRCWSRRYYASANSELRAWWGKLRQRAPDYGFGRCETLPVLSCAEGLARYVGSYVGSEWEARRPEDRGLRSIRYSLSHRAASCRWSWVGGAGSAWRLGVGVLAALVQADGIDSLTGLLGNRWSWCFRKEIAVFGRHQAQLVRWIAAWVSDEWDFTQRLALVSELAGELFAYERERGMLEQEGGY